MGQPWVMEAEEPERTFSVNDARAFLVTRAKVKDYWAVGDFPYQSLVRWSSGVVMRYVGGRAHRSHHSHRSHRSHRTRQGHEGLEQPGPTGSGLLQRPCSAEN